jgi:hypothetical protein
MHQFDPTSFALGLSIAWLLVAIGGLAPDLFQLAVILGRDYWQRRKERKTQ